VSPSEEIVEMAKERITEGVSGEIESMKRGTDRVSEGISLSEELVEMAGGTITEGVSVKLESIESGTDAGP
jgi:hypothetical protein